MIRRYTTYILSSLMALATAACSENDMTGDVPGNGNTTHTGEMVLFTVGTTENVDGTTRAQDNSTANDAKTYYMPDGSRFVCRMYYIAKEGTDEMDLSGTDKTTFLKVNGSVGNSLYWNRMYNEAQSVDEYGNDYYASCFYWQNRKKHVFLAWTDLNHAKTMTFSTAKGSLKFEPSDIIYKKQTGKTAVQDVLQSYQIYGVNQVFETWEGVRSYVIEHGKDDDFIQKQEEMNMQYPEKDSWKWEYDYGWSCKTVVADNRKHNINLENNTFSSGWNKYLMFFTKQTYSGSLDKLTPEMNEEGLTSYYKNQFGHYVCAVIPAGSSYYYATDEDGNVKYDETKPEFSFFYTENYKTMEAEVVEELPANVFSLKRVEGMTHITDQPDVVRAIKEQEPLGATQAANRVNLYFRHQFAQVEVNVKNSADNSVMITSDDILSVELLGVSEEAYLFTSIDKEGKVEPTTYKDVNVTDYTDEELAENPYGTAFSLFDMYDEDKDNNGYATGYLKSFNGITFGQLQAIRIKWKENTTGIIHTVVYRVSKTHLQNLESGKRYVWNMELRRGTLAVIRAEIADWEIDPTAYSADGGIKN